MKLSSGARSDLFGVSIARTFKIETGNMRNVESNDFNEAWRFLTVVSLADLESFARRQTRANLPDVEQKEEQTKSFHK